MLHFNSSCCSSVQYINTTEIAVVGAMLNVFRGWPVTVDISSVVLGEFVWQGLHLVGA